MYKNPKKPKSKGVSAMQPAATSIDGASGVKLVKGEVTNGEVPVNDEKFWRRRAEDVPADEVSSFQGYEHIFLTSCCTMLVVLP